MARKDEIPFAENGVGVRSRRSDWGENRRAKKVEDAKSKEDAKVGKPVPVTEVEKAEVVVEEAKHELEEVVKLREKARTDKDEKTETELDEKVKAGKGKIAVVRKRLNEVRTGKVVTAQVEQKQEEVVEEVKEAVKVKTAAKTGGIRDVEEIMAGLPDMDEETMEKMDKSYKDMVDQSYSRTPALLEVRDKIEGLEQRPDFKERMESDSTFEGVYDQLKQVEQNLLTKDPKLSGRMEFDAYVKSLNNIALEIKAKKVEKWDIPWLVNQVCDGAVGNKRIEVIPWKEADELKKAGEKLLYNNYAKNGTTCYRSLVDDNYGVVTGATEKVLHAIGWILSEAYKRGPTERDMKQRRVKAAKDALKDIERRMKARCSKVPVSQIIDRDGVNEKTLLFCKSDAYVVQEGTKREHEISAAAFCVRIVIPRFKKGKDVVLGEPQIVPVQALGRRADTFVEMVEKQISIPVQAILNERFVLTDRDEKVRRLKIILRKMVEAAIRQYKLEHTPQKPKARVAKKVKPAKKVETAKVVEVEETPKKVAGADYWTKAVEAT